MNNIHVPVLHNKKRKYLPQEFELKSWEDIKPFYEELNSRTISSVSELENWLLDRNELEDYLAENAAWRYINYTRNTEDQEIRDKYLFFINQIKPSISPFANQLDKKLNNSPYKSRLKGEAYQIYLRSTQNEIELFREENIPLIVQTEEKAQEYAEIAAAMTIEYNGVELTLQQAARYLKSSDRNVRKEI